MTDPKSTKPSSADSHPPLNPSESSRVSSQGEAGASKLPPAFAPISSGQKSVPKLNAPLGAKPDKSEQATVLPKLPPISRSGVSQVKGTLRHREATDTQREIELPVLLTEEGGEESLSHRATQLEVAIISDSDIDMMLEQLVSAKGGAPSVRSEFSTPQRASVEALVEKKQDFSLDHSLELGQGLSADLQSTIAQYDEEIQYSKPGFSVNVAAIHMAIARLLDHAGLEKLVYTRYTKALERNPSSIAATRELRRIARAYSKWNDVDVLLDTELNAPISNARRCELIEEKARLNRFKSSGKEESLKSLEFAVNLYPDKVSLRELLLFETASTHRWSEFADQLNFLGQLVNDPLLQSSFYQMRAEVYHYVLNDPLAATTNYLQSLSSQPSRLFALLPLLSLLNSQERWNAMAKVVQQFIQNNDDLSTNHALYLLLSVFFDEKQENRQLSIELLKKASQIDKNDKLPMEILREIFQNNRSYWRDLDLCYLQLFSLSSNPQEKEEFCILRAKNVQKNSDDPQRATEILRLGYDEMPRSRVILKALCESLSKDGRIEDFAHFEKIHAQQLDKDEAADKYAELGVRIIELAGSEDEAILCLEMALSHDPEHLLAFESLERIYRVSGRFEELLRIFEARLVVCSSLRKKATILKSMANIYEFHLQQNQKAIESLKLYRQIYPDDLEAITTLKRLYLAQRQWPMLMECLGEELKLTESAQDRCKIYTHLAQICLKQLKNKEKAIALLHKALEEDSSQLRIYRKLVDLLRDEENWVRLLETYKAMLPLIRTDDEKLVLLCEMAEINKDNLDKSENAIALYKEALQLSPQSNQAFYGLSDIYKQRSDWTSYVKLVLERAQLPSSSASKMSLLLRVAIKYALQLHRYDEAQQLLERAQEIDPSYVPAALLLDIIYATTDQWEKLCESLELNISRDLKPQTKAELCYRLASIYVWKLKREKNAIQPLELSLALSQDLSCARFLLIHNFMELEQYRDLCALFYEAAQVSKDKNFSIALCRSAADMTHYEAPENQEESLHSEELSALRRILELDPNDSVAIERLESMNPHRSQLMQYWEKRLQNAQGDEAVELRLSIAEVLFQTNPQKAFTLITEAVDLSPQHMPAVRMAANTALKLNNYMLACRYRTEEALRLEKIENKIAAFRHAADMAKKLLNRPDIALFNLRQAFLISPQDQALCDELLELLEQQQDWDGMNEILAMHVNYLSSDNKAERYMQMARIYLELMHEPQQAIVKLRQLLEIEHDNTAALEMLARIEISLEHWSEARYALLSLIESPRLDPEKSRKYKLILASLLAQRLSKAQQAAQVLHTLVNENENDVEALKLLARIYTEEGKYEESLNQYEKLNAILKAPKNIEALLNMAAIYKTLNRIDKLNETMALAVKLVPLDASILESLEQWIMQCDELSVILSFVQELLNNTNVDPQTMVKIYAFVFKCYAGPLHMRFEADKYAIAAAQLAPNDLSAQLLAARVFDPNEALSHAFEAMNIDPYCIDVYRAIFNIAENSHKLDLQARAEQALIAFGEGVRKSSPLQNTFTIRHPDPSTPLTLENITSVAHEKFNFWAVELLKKAGPQAQIFALPPLATETLNPNHRFVSLVREIGASLDLPEYQIKIAPSKLMFTTEHDAPEILVFNNRIIEFASENEQRFHIASALTHIKLGSILLKILDAKDMLRLFNGLLGLAYEGFGESDIVKRLNSFLSRKERKSVIEHIRSMPLEQIKIDAAELQVAAFLTEIRLGLLFCADLDAATTGLLRATAQGAKPSTDPQQRLLQLPHLAGFHDLLVFNLSEKYADLRKQLKLNIKTHVQG